MIIQKGLRAVTIESNTYGGETTWSALYSVHGSAVESRTFKSERGAIRWGNARVSR